MRFASASLVAEPRRKPAGPGRGAWCGPGTPHRGLWAGGAGSWRPRWLGGLGDIWETVTWGGFGRILFFFAEAGEYGSAESSWGQALRPGTEELGKMARIRVQGTPNLKEQIKSGMILLEKMPRPIRAFAEALNVWMKVPSWTSYGLRAAGCSFAGTLRCWAWEPGLPLLKAVP